jgi:beta-mannosidase
MSRIRQSLPPWTVGHAPAANVVPARFVPATVPGAVQLDWAQAEGWDEHWKGDNFKQYAWMEDVFWLYRTTLPDSSVSTGSRRFLTLLGVDYHFEVRLDGHAVLAQEGMFTPVEVDVTAYPGAALEVLVWPAPKYPQAHRPKAEASRSCKPAVSYGWDWHPRLIPLGIWDDAFVEDRPQSHLQKAAVSYVLADDFALADVAVEVKVAEPALGQKVRFTLRNKAGEPVIAAEAPAAALVVLPASLRSPELWWPNEQGDAYLYTSTVELLDAHGNVFDTHRAKVGFRRARLVMNEGAWEEPA